MSYTPTGGTTTGWPTNFLGIEQLGGIAYIEIGTPNDSAGVLLDTIVFEIINTPPVADNDSYNATEDTQLSESAPGVLDGDTDDDGDALTAVLDDDVSKGSLSLSADGSFTYDPDDNFCGDDSFTYHANDGTADSNIATVSITVACVNDPPTITTLPDESVDEDSGPHTVNPFAVASPGGGDDEVGQTFTWNVNNVTNSWLFTAGPAIDSDGVLTYTLAADANGTSVVTVTVTDSGGGDDTSGSDDFNIAVKAVNDPPQVSSVSLASQTVDYSDNITTVTVEVTDIDDASTTLAESGEPAESVSSLSLTAATPNCVTDNTLSPNATEIGSVCTWTYGGQVLSPGDNVHDIVFTPSDGDGAGTVTGTHELTIEPEDADVMLAADNDVAAEVDEPGGDSGPFSLFFSSWETVPDFSHGSSAAFGDLNKMEPFMTLIPVGPGNPVDADSCSLLEVDPDYSVGGYDQVAYFRCDFDDVPVNTYEVVAAVDGATLTTRYYVGSDDDVFTVFDPSLGFTTGGGWFYWPDTADEELTECGPDGYPGDKTNFGFNLKYNKKKKTAKGSVLVMRHTVDENCLDAGSYRVKSNAIEGMSLGEGEDGEGKYGWASAAGKSVFREPGMEGEGNHSFLMYVEDHGQQGCDQDPVDEFWIEVKDKAELIVLQLNGPVSEVGGVDAEPIVCGNIVVPHKAGKGGGGGGGGPKEPNPNKPPKG